MQNLISVKIKEDKIMSKNTTVKNPMKVITGEDTRWSYVNVWEPKSINGGAPKYSVSLTIPKSDTKTVAKIKAAIEAAYTEGESKLKGNSKSVPPLTSIKTPLRDGDVERPDDPAYANAYFINANSATAPGIVDADLNSVLTRSEVYSGVYGRASITLYAFNSNGNRGIAHSIVLKPYVETLQNGCTNAPMRRIQQIQTLLLENAEQRETLTKLMAQRYIDQILYNEENNTLLSQADRYRQEMDTLSKAIGGDGAHVTAAKELLRYVEKAAMLTDFDEALFENTVTCIKVLSREEIAFELKCGLTLKERM